MRFDNKNVLSDFKHDMKEVRMGLRMLMKDEYELETSFRENMPQAGIIYDVTKSDEELLKDMNESCRKRVKKSIEK